MSRRPLPLLASAFVRTLVVISVYLGVARQRVQEPRTRHLGRMGRRLPRPRRRQAGPHAQRVVLHRARLAAHGDPARGVADGAVAGAGAGRGLRPRARRGSCGGRPTSAGASPTSRSIPRDANVVFAGTAEGGVLRTATADSAGRRSSTTRPPSRSAPCALDPSDPDVVYAGTGEVNPGGGQRGLRRRGDPPVHRSAATPGSRWGSRTAARSAASVIDPDRLAAASSSPPWATSGTTDPDRGVYRTTRRRRHLAARPVRERLDRLRRSRSMRPDEPGTCCSPRCGSGSAGPSTTTTAASTCGVYRSDRRRRHLVARRRRPARRPAAASGRIGLSLCAAQPDVMHAVYADRTGYFAGLYRSRPTAGRRWARTSDGALTRRLRLLRLVVRQRAHPPGRTRTGSSSSGSTSTAPPTAALELERRQRRHARRSSRAGVRPRRQSGDLQRQRRRRLPLDQRRHRLDHAARPADHPGLPRRARRAATPTRSTCGAQDNGTVRTLTGALDDWEDDLRRRRLPAAGPSPEPAAASGPSTSTALVNYSSNGGCDLVQRAPSASAAATGSNWNSPLVPGSREPRPPLLRHAAGLPQQRQHELDRDQPATSPAGPHLAARRPGRRAR